MYYDLDHVNHEIFNDSPNGIDTCVDTYEIIVQKEDGTGQMAGTGFFLQDTSCRKNDPMSLWSLDHTKIWNPSTGETLYDGPPLHGRGEALETVVSLMK